MSQRPPPRPVPIGPPGPTGNVRYVLMNRLFRKPLLVLEVELGQKYVNHRDAQDPKNGEVYTRWVKGEVHHLVQLAKMGIFV